jgi:alpha-beta hydrolase superfamily lysophospholipase
MHCCRIAGGSAPFLWVSLRIERMRADSQIEIKQSTAAHALEPDRYFIKVMPIHTALADDQSNAATPLYFGPPGRRLFGWLHRPANGERDLALVICKPFGYEAVCSNRSIRAFAEMAAASGVTCLRFDYLGTGDSDDIDVKADQLDAWTENVLAAIDELKRQTGISRVCLLGLRLGATIATLVSARSPALAGLLLISPLVSGRRYLKDLRNTRMAAAMGSEAAAGTGADAPTPDGSMEVSGFALSAATIHALAAVDLIKMPPPPCRTLVIDGASLPVARKWSESLPSPARYVALPGLIEMVMALPQEAEVPAEMLTEARAWLHEISTSRAETSTTSESRQSSSQRSVQEVEPEDRSSILYLAGPDINPRRQISERPVWLHSDTRLFGIVTTPPIDEKRRRGVILLNAGATYHMGPNRQYVTLARQWARRGYYVLRFDLQGLGDSGTRNGQPDNEVFPPAALDDIRAAIEFMRIRYGVFDLSLCGICSGAYHALRAAAAALPISRVLMINPQNFYWEHGTAIDALTPAEVVMRSSQHRERIFSREAWKRVLTGQVDMTRLALVYVQRPLITIGTALRRVAASLKIRLPDDIGAELEEIVARGIKVVFVFASGEAGLELLRVQGGSRLARLGDRCTIHVIENADHVFSRADTREIMEHALSQELYSPVVK